MKPGRELDAMIAERIMGWTPWDSEAGDWLGPDDLTIFAKPDPRESNYSGIAVYRPSEDGDVSFYFAPSTDISSAWEVVEWAMKRFPECRFTLDHLWGFKAPENWWRAAWCPINDVGDSERSNVFPEARGDTAPHAICLAALQAVGVEVKVPALSPIGGTISSEPSGVSEGSPPTP